MAANTRMKILVRLVDRPEVVPSLAFPAHNPMPVAAWAYGVNICVQVETQEKGWCGPLQREGYK